MRRFRRSPYRSRSDTRPRSAKERFPSDCWQKHWYTRLALRITGDIRRVHDANLSTRVHSLLRSGVIRLLGILAGILVGVLIILLRVGRRIGIGCVRLIAGSGVGLGLGLALAALALFGT